MGGGKVNVRPVDAWGVRWRWCVGCWGVFNLGGLGEMELFSWEGLSAVSFGILFHLFSASIFSQRFFVDPNLREFFCNRVAT